MLINRYQTLVAAQQLLRKAGLNVTRASNTLDRKRAFFFRKNQIDLVIDVGANVGQYARRLRRAGYTGRIISFEPLKPEFTKLFHASKEDPSWDCHNVALGRANTEMVINVSWDSVSSSLLRASEDYVRAIPKGATMSQETVAVRQLDSFKDHLLKSTEVVHLKLDVQGYEMEVLLGAEGFLQRVQSIESEMSLMHLYENQPLVAELVRYLDARGFTLVWLERLFVDPGSGHLWQVDGIFLKR